MRFFLYAMLLLVAVVRAEATNVVLYSPNVVPTLCRPSKTGQTNVYYAGDNGTYVSGYAWPTPRFTVGTGAASNCVTDNLTGLMWIKNPLTNTFLFADGIDYCEALDGDAGRGGYTDWRMPNTHELLSVMAFGPSAPALPVGHPFSPVPGNVWTSTTWAQETTYARWVTIGAGYLNVGVKTTTALQVWPVRGGL